MDKKDVFKEFITKNGVLVVDKNPSSRSRLLKIMCDLGAKRTNVHTASSIKEAEEIINSKNIGVVLSDYFVSGGSGFDLFKMIREKEPLRKDLCLVLVTGNVSQTAVAKAAEEDVDSFILKPFTVDSIQNSLITTITNKIKPNPYFTRIDEGKILIEEGKYDDAIKKLKSAVSLNLKPSLAQFYIGQAEYLKEQAENAIGSYNKGLEFSNIHYKCLVGLYQIFIKNEKYDDAYHVVKKIAKFYPANPDRLMEIIRLTVKTSNFEDMKTYYEIFTALDERPSTVVKYVGAGLYVAGKYYLKKNDLDKALQYFDNVAVSCSEFPKFIRAIISTLVECDKADHASKYLSQFAVETKNDEDYMVSDYLVTSKTINDMNLLIRSGLDLYNNNVRDYFCMKFLVEAMKKSGQNQEKIKPFIEEINKRWPDKMIG